MNNLPFDTEGLDIDEAELLQATYMALKSKYNISIAHNKEFSLSDFDLFFNNPYLTLGGILAVNQGPNNCFLIFIKIKEEYKCSYKGQGAPVGLPPDYFKYQAWGLITSKKDYGRVMIRQETLTDRIVGLVHPVELEFEDDKAFSHKYYVVANDKEKALTAISWTFRNAVMSIKDGQLLIETAGNMLVIGKKEFLDIEQTIALTETLLKLAIVS